MIASLLIGLALAQPSIELDAVGDVMLDRYVGRHLQASGAGYALAMVRPKLSGADLVVANLECPLTTQPKRAFKHFVFRASPAATPALRGIDAVSLANNHTLDCGAAGLSDTIAALRGIGVGSIGAGEDPWKPLVVVRRGVRVAFFGFCDFRQESGGEPKIAIFDSEKLRRAIADVRTRVDVVVVFAHWGIEGLETPSARQRSEAKEIASDGADLILGSHPHVLQPVERIGRTVVAYSMGNFVFDSVKPKDRATAIFRFRLSRSGAAFLGRIPCTIRGARPVPAG